MIGFAKRMTASVRMEKAKYHDVDSDGIVNRNQLNEEPCMNECRYLAILHAMLDLTCPTSNLARTVNNRPHVPPS